MERVRVGCRFWGEVNLCRRGYRFIERKLEFCKGGCLKEAFLEWRELGILKLEYKVRNMGWEEVGEGL